ncbi:MAG TPA: pseudouridine synthase, partial [Pirellulaceae bacterium]|nr:pseudouridine synthase [Pirellulaceae bacterium]
IVTELGTRVDPLRQEIRVDGQPLRRPQRLYFAVNKPVGVVTTNNDPSGRPRVIDLVPTDERVFAVGRLDRASEGLILVTNDGEFANRITHPRYGVEKTYLVRVAGSPTPADLARLTKGVYLSDGFCRVQSITVKRKQGQSTDLVMVLNEGRNRELRRILARVGHKVLRLKRIAVGSIKLADQPVGAWRRLAPDEIESLLRLAKEKRKAAKSKRKTPRLADGQQPGGMKPVGGQRQESPYRQQQALMAEPLSLADLLRDDLDEGNLAAEEVADTGGIPASAAEQESYEDAELRFSKESQRGKPGGVIAYEGGEASGAEPRGRRGGKRRRRDAHGRIAAEQQPEKLPRESFGKKRSGKRIFGRPHQGRGPAGQTAGNFDYRPAGQPKKKSIQKDERPSRPAKRGKQRFAKAAGGKFGKPGGGKKFVGRSKRKGRR